MYTSTLLVALVGLLAPSMLSSPSWQTDYDAARRMGREGGKPLAVFVGSGKAGWNQLVAEGQLSKESSRILSAGYVCLYVDLTATDGNRLAEKLGIGESPSLILSDVTGKLQAYRHEGDLADEDLARCLQKYADPARVVQATEDDAVVRMSYYSADQAQQAPTYYAPTAYYPSFGGGGRSC
jgi:hypothetical protein